MTKKATLPAKSPDRRRRLTDQERKTMETCIKVGLSLRTALQAIEMSPQVWSDITKREPGLAERLDAIAAKTKGLMAAKLVEKALSGNLPALIFWLKTRCTEFREVILEAEVDDNVTANDFRFE